MKQVRVFNNFLSKEDWDDAFFGYLAKPDWGFGHISNPSSNMPLVPYYWKMMLNEHKFFTNYILGKINQAVGENLALENVYAGGNTFGASGEIHRDHTDPKARTFLYHASPDTWNPMWGGKTIFYPEGMENEYYEFVPNQGLYFKSSIPHVGEATTKYFDGLRICIAFKLVVL